MLENASPHISLLNEAKEFRNKQLPPSPWGDKHIVNRLAAALEEADRKLAELHFLCTEREEDAKEKYDNLEPWQKTGTVITGLIETHKIREIL